MTDTSENASHAEMEDAVATGHGVMFSDEQLPGGRFQKVAFVLGGDLWLAEWRQNSDGNWTNTNGFLVPRGTLPQLAQLLRSKGYHITPAPT